MKIQKSDILSVLDFFGVTPTSGGKARIDQISSRHPKPYNQLVSFRLNNHEYRILIDDTAGDDIGYISTQLSGEEVNLNYTVLKNPHTEFETYGMPYEGKIIYLLELHDTTKRLDTYLAEVQPELSRSSWQKLIKDGHVTVNSVVTKVPKIKVTDTDIVEYAMPEKQTTHDIELPIIYIDDDVIVVDKPAGVLTHAKNPLDNEFTVADFFARYSTDALDENRSGVVHRLDRDTSGVIIGARTASSYDYLKSQFASREVQKTYVAITDGIPSSPQLNIDLPIMRNPSKPGTFMAKRDGKSAQTKLAIIESNHTHSMVELQPKTGRTHQLRVHLAYIKCPIHGDRLYGKPADRLYLHAHKLKLRLPSGDEAEFTSPVPRIFDNFMRK